MKDRPPYTMLDLVQKLQCRVRSEDEVVAVVSHLINTGRAVLAGTFAGQRITGIPPDTSLPCPALILALVAEFARVGALG